MKKLEVKKLFLAAHMRRVTSIALATASISLSIWGCSGPTGDNGNAAVVTVQAQKPQIGPIAEKITADAVLSPLSEAVISPKVTAPVKAFFVQRGSHVRTGQLLATLDNQDLAAALLDSKGQYEAEQAAYNTQTKAQLPEAYQKAVLDVRQATAQVRLNESIVASRQKLFNEGAIAGRDLDTAKAALVQAKVAYESALSHLKGMQSVSREEALKEAQGQLTSAKGRYLAAQAQLAFTQIRSPINGVVTDRPLFPGEMANSGSSLITVMDTSALIAKVHLPEVVAQQLSLGDKAEVMIPGVDNPVSATVSLISPALDPGSTTVEVWLKIKNPQGKYKAGTPIHALITGHRVANALQVPLSALLTADDGGKYVMVVGSDGTAHKIGVTVGINDNKNVQITSGLKPGDQVIVGGAYGLPDKTRVNVAPEQSSADGSQD
jgi:HlyD family secretion protein